MPTGVAAFAFEPYDADALPALRLSFFRDGISLPQYRVEQLLPEETSSVAAAAQTEAAAVNGSNGGGSEGGGAGAAAGGVGMVSLRALTAVVLRVAGVPVLDACEAWMLDQVRPAARGALVTCADQLASHTPTSAHMARFELVAELHALVCL